MSCATKALGALVSVLITGKVTESDMPNVNVGEKMQLSFIVEKEALVRNIVGQGIVTDGIAPYQVCTDDFALTFDNKVHMHLGDLPMLEDGSPSYAWFSLMEKRVVDDGAWVSMDAVDGSKGVPLAVHGTVVDATGKPATTYGGVFDLSFPRGTIKSLDVSSAVGSSITSGAGKKGTLQVWRGWSANTVLTA